MSNRDKVRAIRQAWAALVVPDGDDILDLYAQVAINVLCDWHKRDEVMNDPDLVWLLTMRALMVFAAICWLVVGIGVALMLTVEPGAISMVIGVGIWAVITTIAAIGWRVTK